MLELLYNNILTLSSFKDKVDNLPKNSFQYVRMHLTKERKKDNTFEELNSDISENILYVTVSETIVEKDVSLDTKSLDEASEEIGISNIVENNQNGVLLQEIDQTIESTEYYEPISNKKLKYETVSLDYFNNSLFIGDSRMAGFEIYKKIPGAMYFCYSSASVFNIFEYEDNVAPIGNIKLFDLLSTHKFDKIYIMLGINSLQINYYNHKKQYKEALDRIKELQPQAIIYLVANLHVTDHLDPTKLHLTNANVNLVNDFIKKYADNVQTFYLDPNPMYDDENGNLKLELSTDNVHIHIVHYDKFLVYLLSNALVEDDSVYSNVIGPKGQ